MIWRFEDFSLETDRRELRRGEGLVTVEPQAFGLLAYLIESRDRVVSKDDLVATIWGGRIVSESGLTTGMGVISTDRRPRPCSSRSCCISRRRVPASAIQWAQRSQATDGRALGAALFALGRAFIFPLLARAGQGPDRRIGRREGA